MHTLTRHDVVAEIAGSALAWIGGQEFLTQSRCVDVLLDLLGEVRDPFTRWAITSRLDEIRYLRIVPGDAMRADLAAIVDITAPGDGTSSSWCDRLLAGCSAAA